MSKLAARQLEHPVILFPGREGTCSCCLPGSNKEVPTGEMFLQPSCWMSAREAKQPLLVKNSHRNACV